MTRAKLSEGRKFAICGRCDRTLARRDRIIVDDVVAFDLVWDDDWHQTPGFGDLDTQRHDASLNPTIGGSLSDRGSIPGYIARTLAAMDRLADGYAPTRRGSGQGRKFEGDFLARCPWCDAINEINRRKLQLTG